MGVLNVTPDSFSDGGKFYDPVAATAHARSMTANGADLIDIGGESTRPGALPVDAAEQIRRVIPVIQAIRRELPITISIDTTRKTVAQAALDAGANIINDISAGRDDAQMLSLAATRKTPIILMHMRGWPATMQHQPELSGRNIRSRRLLRRKIADFANSWDRCSRCFDRPGSRFRQEGRAQSAIVTRPAKAGCDRSADGRRCKSKIVSRQNHRRCRIARSPLRHGGGGRLVRD